VGDPDLLVDHKRAEGDLTIPTEPGGKYRFGAVVSRNPRFLSSRHLQDIARFKRGQIYQRTDQEDLKRAILATGLVSSVTVTPREVTPPPPPTPGAPAPTGEVALDVGLVSGPLRTIAGQVGYDTADGFRLEASWEHRNFFPPEGMLRLRGIAGTKEQLVGTTVRWNNWHGRDQVLTLDLYGNTVNRDAYMARTVAFTATFEKLTTLLFQKPWVWSVGLETLATQERESAVSGQTVPRNTFFVAALPLRGAIDRSDDLLDPTRGWRAALRVSPEISKQMVDRGLAALEKFYNICTLSSFPEMADHFKEWWTKKRFFWTGNHVSRHFTLYLFRRLNEKYLLLPFDDAYWQSIDSLDIFARPCTAVTQLDVDGYGLSWSDPIEPLKV